MGYLLSQPSTARGATASRFGLSKGQKSFRATPNFRQCVRAHGSRSAPSGRDAEVSQGEQESSARRRVRSTVAHEAGHGLLHGPLFAETNSPDLRNGADGKNRRLILCRSEDILVDTQRSYAGRWWEFQVNQAMGSLLLPSPLMHTFLDRFGINPASFGSGTLTPPQRESLAKEAAVIFDVNPVVVRIRLDSLFPQKKNHRVQL